MSNNVPTSSSGLSYKDAGVDIDAGNSLVEKIKPAIKRTNRSGNMGGIGGFGGLFDLAATGYRDPVLVSGTDGVGTKLRLAIDHNRHSTVGIDLVAMCANDILVQGAEPLFFLDYFATGKLDVDTAAEVVGGIAAGCEESGCALIGGETAEMPGMYETGDYDLAGFCVGAVERSQIIDGSQVAAGDVILGLPSSGPHSNGYSLIRKVLEVSNTDPTASFGDGQLIDALMAPTKLYIKTLLPLLKAHNIHAMAHITGGGITENLPRVLPEGCAAEIDTQAWTLPPIFQWLQENGNISDADMRITFNCGIGMVLVLSADDAEAVKASLNAAGETFYELGAIIDGDQTVIYK